MWQQQTKIILIISFLLGVGGWVTHFGWTRVQDDQRLVQNSAETQGRVVSSAARPLSKGGKSLTVVVEYAPAGHAAITKEFDVDSGDYKAAQATGNVTVTYVPEDPEISRVTKFAIMPYQILIGFGGVMLMAGLFCLVHAVKTRTKK